MNNTEEIRRSIRLLGSMLIIVISVFTIVTILHLGAKLDEINFKIEKIKTDNPWK